MFIKITYNVLKVLVLLLVSFIIMLLPDKNLWTANILSAENIYYHYNSYLLNFWVPENLTGCSANYNAKAFSRDQPC